MKISEMIAALQSLLAEIGDAPVVTVDCEGELDERPYPYFVTLLRDEYGRASVESFGKNPEKPGEFVAVIVE